MAKFRGVIGYKETLETSPGVWSDKITRRSYSGDFIRVYSRWKPVETQNDDIVFDVQISILADSYAYKNFDTIRYVEWNKTKWSVKTIEVQRPRVNIWLGGVYNEHSS